jgi:hypothetical protein
MLRRRGETEALREEAQREKGRAALLRGVLRRIVELEDERRRVERDYERAIIDARGLLHPGSGERSDDR